MTAKLETILASLSTDESRIAFLERAYYPGNIEVADAMLTLEPNQNVRNQLLESEIEFVVKQKSIGLRVRRYHKLLQQFISENLKAGRYSTVSDAVRRWDVPQKMAIDAERYILDHVNIEELNSARSVFKQLIDIVIFEGGEKKARDIAAQMVGRLKKEDNVQYPLLIVEYCQKLRLYQEAIDICLKSDYHMVDDALEIALKHAQGRLQEVARHGFNNYESGWEEVFTKCADILGPDCLKEAKAKLIAQASKMPGDRLHAYDGLVKSLMKLGAIQEAKDFVRKCADAQKNEARRNSSYWTRADQVDELVDLFKLVGEKPDVSELYLAVIDTHVAYLGRPEPEDMQFFLRIADQGHNLTGGLAFLEKKRILLENQGEYQQASEIAKELRKTTLVTTYLEMQKLVDASQGPAVRFDRSEPGDNYD